MDLSKLHIRPLRRDELNLAVDWAAAEGWNPGLSDAEVFWRTDPEGFLGAEYEGELVATGSVVSYGGQFGFMGFFIVKPGLRGRGIGTRLWVHLRDLLKSRLSEDAAIGMDGVFDMQDWYRRGGFQFTHRNLRMNGLGRALPESEVRPGIVFLSEVSFDQLAEYDRKCFGCERERFLRAWIETPNTLALGFVLEGALVGYGVIRRCREGYKIGPLFANDEEVASALFFALGNSAAGEPIWMDVPEINDAAMRVGGARVATIPMHLLDADQDSFPEVEDESRRLYESVSLPSLNSKA